MAAELGPKDPLKQASGFSGQELFNRFRREAHEFPHDAAITAAANIIINSLRQQHPTRKAALEAFDEYFGRSKQALSDHYDASGRKKGIFPYHQVIHVGHFDENDKF